MKFVSAKYVANSLNGLNEVHGDFVQMHVKTNGKKLMLASKIQNLVVSLCRAIGVGKKFMLPHTKQKDRIITFVQQNVDKNGMRKYGANRMNGKQKIENE